MLRPFLVRLLLLLGSLAFCLALAEAGLRIYQRIVSGVPLLASAATHIYVDGKAPVLRSCVLDERLGWRPTPNLRFDGQGQRADGTRYALHVTQDSSGFRAFGHLRTTKPRILFLGDSFTQAVEVSDDDTYYAWVGKDLDVEIFALGARGYSTFQEYLILDQVIDRIEPDLIVWQFCFNDFMANSYAVERAWTASAMGMARPFWEGGRIAHRIPESYAWLLELTGGHSRFLFLSTIRYEQMLYRLDGRKDVLLDDIYQRGLRQPSFRMAVDKTGEILQMVSRRSGEIPVVLWEACSADPPFLPVLKELGEQIGMHFVGGIPAVLDLPEHRGQVLLSLDRIHWNPEGHRIIGEALARYLRSTNLLQRPRHVG